MLSNNSMRCGFSSRAKFRVQESSALPAVSGASSFRRGEARCFQLSKAAQRDPGTQRQAEVVEVKPPVEVTTIFERCKSLPFDGLGTGVWDSVGQCVGGPSPSTSGAVSWPAERDAAASGPNPPFRVSAPLSSSSSSAPAPDGLAASSSGPASRALPRSQQVAPGPAPSALAPTDDLSASTSTASVLEVDEHCAEKHPGSISCTTTTVEKDATTNACVVTLKSTVRLTDARLQMDPTELEELAWLAVRDAASENVLALNRQSTRGPAGREERHRFVCQMLSNGTIVDAKRMENGFGHVTYLVVLEDGKGRRMRAAFKPRVEGDGEGWHRVPIEVAAYQLNLLLGMDVVPPAVFREEADVDWTHYPAGGAFIYWCGGARQLDTVPMHDWSLPSASVLSDTRILDVLIQNSDRHAGHFLYAEHWADGSYVPQPSPQQQRAKGGGSSTASLSGWRGRMSPVLIDHAAGFRPDAFVCLDHENAFTTGPTRHISARTYLRLRFLDAPTLQSAMGGILTPEEVAALLSRRDSMLAFFDGLVADKGYGSIVLEA